MPVEPPSLKLWTVSCHRLVQLTNLCVCLFKMSTKLAVCVLCNASRLPATGSAWDRNTVVCPRAFFLKWRMYSTCLKWFFVVFFFCKGMNSLSWITNVAFSCRHWYCTSWPCGNWCSEARDGGYFCPCQCYNWSKICRDAPRSPERSSAWW